MASSKQAIAMLVAFLVFFGIRQPADASMAHRKAKEGRRRGSSSDDNDRREIEGGKKKEETQGRGGRSVSCGTQFVDPNDFGLRFNKMTEGLDQSGVLPLGAHDYPLCPATVDELRMTDAVSVIDYHTCDECDIPMDDLVTAAGGWPSHPSSASLAFWEELWEVVKVQERRLK